jgi:hypothetical protein
MITNTTQDWSVGSEVRVGFCKLIVEGIEVTEEGHDLYYLRNAAGDKHYTFTPHLGLRTNSGKRQGVEWVRPLDIAANVFSVHTRSGTHVASFTSGIEAVNYALSRGNDENIYYSEDYARNGVCTQVYECTLPANEDALEELTPEDNARRIWETIRNGFLGYEPSSRDRVV